MEVATPKRWLYLFRCGTLEQVNAIDLYRGGRGLTKFSIHAIKIIKGNTRVFELDGIVGINPVVKAQFR